MEDYLCRIDFEFQHVSRRYGMESLRWMTIFEIDRCTFFDNVLSMNNMYYNMIRNDFY